MQSMQIC